MPRKPSLDTYDSTRAPFAPPSYFSLVAPNARRDTRPRSDRDAIDPATVDHAQPCPCFACATYDARHVR